MWISGFFLRAAMAFYTQANVEDFHLFHRHCGGFLFTTVFHRKFSTFHRLCGKMQNAELWCLPAQTILYSL